MGLAPLFEQGTKYLTTSSTEAAATKPARKAEASEPVPMQSLDALYATAQQAVPGLEARYVSLRRWGTGTAEVGFTGNLRDHLASTARVDIHAATGVAKKVHDPRTAGFWSLVNSLMEPLHFLALHATTPAALIVAVFVHLWGPAGLPSLAQRPVWAVWSLIGVWLLLSALAAGALRTLALWRVALGGAGGLLALAGITGLVLGSVLAPAMFASLVALGLACAGIAAFIGPQRVQAPRRKAVRHAAATAGTRTHPAPARRRRHPRGWGHGVVLAHGPFWLSGVLAVESFRLAHIVATEPARSSGMLGLLLAMLVALPAATLRHWERGDRKPHGASLVLLNVIQHNPRAVIEALAV
jgi:hypothetical protein